MDRVILLVGDIEWEMAAQFMAAFEEIDATKGRIVIKIASAGGLTSAGFAMYDRIKESKNQVVVEGYGEVCSMAVIILQAGDVRRLSPNTRVMVHNTGAEVEGTLQKKDFNRTGKELREVGNMYNRCVSERSGIPIKTLVDWCDKETYFSAKEAVAAGLADEVIGIDLVKPKKGKRNG